MTRKESPEEVVIYGKEYFRQQNSWWNGLYARGIIKIMAFKRRQKALLKEIRERREPK